ncbi:MAG: O-antigen ligase family protein [Anaerolineae bacterium]|nr:O-antigen ligase family protein [Thermoflexus sp.]MDW8064749.1 O-antigen ligase family protein [Anaerolineae bacterium]
MNEPLILRLIPAQRRVVLILGLIAAWGLGWAIALGGPILAIAGLLGAILIVFILSSVDVAFLTVLAVIFLLPFGTFPVRLGFTPTLLDLAVMGWLLAGLAWWAAGRLGTPHGTALGFPVLIFLGTTLVTFIAGLAHAPLTQTVARRFAEFLLAIASFFWVVTLVREEIRLSRLIRWIIGLGFLTALIAVVLYVLPDSQAEEWLLRLQPLGYYREGGPTLRYILDDPEQPERAIGTAVDPNLLGATLATLILLTLPQIFASQPMWPRPLIALFLGTMGLALLLTFSRGAFIGTATAVLALSLFRYRRLLPMIVVGLILLFLLPVTQDFAQHLLAGLRGEDLATRMRFGEYRDALTLIMRYPLFGVGFAGVPDVDLYIKVASIYLLLAVQMGLVGLGIFLLVIAAFFGMAWNARHIVRNRPDLEPIWLGLHGAVVAALISGVFDHHFVNFDFHHMVQWFWLLIGLGAAATRMASQVSSK